jgi:hypothetical protein
MKRRNSARRNVRVRKLVSQTAGKPGRKGPYLELDHKRSRVCKLRLDVANLGLSIGICLLRRRHIQFHLFCEGKKRKAIEDEGEEYSSRRERGARYE